MNDSDALGHGSTISYDRYGNLVDVSASLNERSALIGRMWRLDLPYTTLSADAIYATISFKTPTTGEVIYNLANVQKTGNELIVELKEGGTYTGGTTTTAVNYNRNTIASSPFQNSFYGVSPTATLTGETQLFGKLVPGSAQGNSIPGGDSAGQGFIVLKPDTVYTLKLTAKGGSVTVMANIEMAYISTATF